ncbi:class I SAM-dependent methyltransferase [Paenibacillus mendelii]|uniref:Class I SAM-dependent methyltransferase n=1 Tax=Paenibacillus mendelii TaxID=206163 RepID=A0ABV6JEK3_9BACL|nr:class I SAM-dependent methyltransferase [Paenibacillus mendelii]MCQ6557161.1 class I SAM-dependent methyltransferase [Paenibacillus mendelii]
MNKQNLVKAYDIDAHRRANSTPAEWKIIERKVFLDRLKQENKQSLLELGAGTGMDSLYFQDNGLNVTCIDLSNEMVRYCKERGLTAKVMDFYHLDFADHSFHAIYALNCLLHVPKHDIDQVLGEIKRVLKPDGLFYMGLYGGKDSEGIWKEDAFEPKRFFASYSDESIRTLAGQHFEEIYFKRIPLDPNSPHFQLLILKNVE